VKPRATGARAKPPGAFTGADDPRRGRGPAKGAANAGRPPDLIRRLCREAFADRIPVLTDIANGKAITVETVQAEGKPAEKKAVLPTPEQRMKAIDLLGKYGLGTTISPMDGEGNAIARFTLTAGDEGE
jgi:hypothetical protein